MAVMIHCFLTAQHFLHSFKPIEMEKKNKNLIYFAFTRFQKVVNILLQFC